MLFDGIKINIMIPIKSECPLNGQCQIAAIIYKCTVLSRGKPNKVIKCTSELLRVISRSDFVIIGSHLAMKLAQTIYGN